MCLLFSDAAIFLICFHPSTIKMIAGNTMKTLGICFGATTVQAVLLETVAGESSIKTSWRIPHEGAPSDAAKNLFLRIDISTVDRVAATGRSFRHALALSSISEPEAIECALAHTFLPSTFPDLCISLGGESQFVYKIEKDGSIGSVHSGNKCASGTGEFFLQQVRRMGLTVEEAVEAANSGTPHRIAGRCSVFCKSDCTHALNKGEPRENIAAGLCVMMANKITELVKDMSSEHVVVIGGGSLNTALLKVLKERFRTVEVPEGGDVFEAYGAAVWASKNECKNFPQNPDSLILDRGQSFGVHVPLGEFLPMVEFKEFTQEKVREGDICILGLDVGSTTTKAVLMRKADRAVVASVYLRTNGDPVRASVQCYSSILKQLDTIKVTIIGLGVTGSGRQITSLHALTDTVINEIIAHAAAALHFDKDVDTIFEIGGQDAKYTYLTGGVASDYAMNEACSAGTGSFLEESAGESLNVATNDIGAFALQGKSPPNFTDQCAAFISSDIKRASQEGIGRNDILAGLVYSICLNYINRVKGARPVGKKIFMQGGVCYNRAVPAAMASLMKTNIIVPPDPGLMGAYGVALEVSHRLDRGTAKEGRFDLEELISRRAVNIGTFICGGGKEKCDRKCEIARYKIGDSIYPFGGICDKYYNLRLKKRVDVESMDLVALRQSLLFEKYGAPFRLSVGETTRRTVGISRSFLTYSLYPFYSGFFSELGFDIIMPDEIDRGGMARAEAAFCLPAELAHGAFVNLLNKNPDYIFLPQVMQLPVKNVPTFSRACVFVQGEPYYLKTTFRGELERSSTKILAPVLKMGGGYEEATEALLRMAVGIGCSESAARNALRKAIEKQRAFERDLQEQGRAALEYLDTHNDTFGIVLFGRPYNSFASDANMGVPHKIASRGYMVIPHDMLPADGFHVHKKMFWAMGQKIMKAAQLVKLRNNLFGVYITNFSCGPDSFLLTFFRNLMNAKPSLTLELDQHTADAGIDTRIEAALDIFKGNRLLQGPAVPSIDSGYHQAQVVYNKDLLVVSSDGVTYPINDSHVEILLPSMGKYSTEAVAAVLRKSGLNARALPLPDKEVLNTGMKNTTCKECLPYAITTGSFLRYLEKKRNPDMVTLLFMATGGGPCRLGQYWRGLDELIGKNRIRNVAVLAMTDENGYGGLGSRNLLRAWKAIIVADVFSEIRSTLRVTAKDWKTASKELEKCWRELMLYFEGKFSVRLSTLLDNVARRLARIPLKRDPSTVPVVSLIGEIFVRREEFSRKNVVDFLEERGFMVKVAPVSEFMCYANFVVDNGLGEKEFTFNDQLKMKLTIYAQEWWERHIKTFLAKSRLYRFEMVDVKTTIDGVRHIVNENFRGETILTIGLAMREILNHSCGIVSIGPFGCMPSRMAEAVLKKEMTMKGKSRMATWANQRNRKFDTLDSLPFLAIETDGNPFPQLIEANLDAFVLQAMRVHEKIAEGQEGKRQHVQSDRYRGGMNRIYPRISSLIPGKR
ncbi:MAG: activase [Chitinivibrionales bacterium]|nr:activase [Chitinivibrionales bacterium]